VGLSVLHLCSLTKRNGTVYMASRTSRLLAAAGHRVTIGARAGAKIFEWTEGAGIEHVELELRSGFEPRSASRDISAIREKIRGASVDVVHAWQSAETYVGAMAVLGTRARLVRTRSIVKPIRAHLGRPLLHRVCKATFVTCKRIELEVLASGFPAEGVVPLVEGVDVARFRPDPAARALRAELGIAADAFLVANVGRLERVKGQVHFLEALARLPERVHGVIAGEGGAREELEARRAELGLGRRVSFLGKRPDVSRILAASDAYALTSIGSEGSSRATLEALACGLPVVCSDVGMLPDLLEGRRVGFLVPAADSAALAERLARLAGDPELCRELGANARALAEAERTEQHMLASVESVYERIARTRAESPR
jgi:glycosyltransferase involved in cell wall biosynthesis